MQAVFNEGGQRFAALRQVLTSGGVRPANALRDFIPIDSL